MDSKIIEYVICQQKALFNIFDISVKIKSRLYASLTQLRKRLCLSRLMFNNLTKVTKILYLNEKKFIEAGFVWFQ